MIARKQPRGSLADRNPETEPFWAAAERAASWSSGAPPAAQPHWYPRAHLPALPERRHRVAARQRAAARSIRFSPMRRADPPYTLAYVTLDEGPTMLTNIVDSDPDALAIGQRGDARDGPERGRHAGADVQAGLSRTTDFNQGHLMSNRHWVASYGSTPREIDPDRYRCVTDMMDEAMKRFADRPAFRCAGQTLTYADVDRLSRDFAAFLQGRLGVKKGDRIAVMTPNLLAFPIAFLGIIRAGAAQANVNPLYTPRELEHQLNDAGVETIVVFSGVSATVAEVMARTKLKTVVTCGVGDGSGVRCPARRWIRGSPARSRWPTRSRRAPGCRSRPSPPSATTCCSCSTPAAPPGCPRVRRCRTATWWPMPSSSRRSCRRDCARGRR